MNVVVKHLQELSVSVVDKGPFHATVRMEIPKYLLWDFLCDGIKFQAKEENTPNVMYCPVEWKDTKGGKLQPKGALRNPDMEALKVFHKAYEVYRMFQDANTNPDLAKQLLPGCNVVTATATVLKEDWEKWLKNLTLSKREDYNHYAAKIMGLLHGE